MNSQLDNFLVRAEQLLVRLEPLLPQVHPTLDWQTCVAARWCREGRSGYLQPLQVDLQLRLSDLLGIDRQ